MSLMYFILEDKSQLGTLIFWSQKGLNKAESFAPQLAKRGGVILVLDLSSGKFITHLLGVINIR